MASRRQRKNPHHTPMTTNDTPLLFRNRFRIPSTRLPGRDYAAPGRYFITICTRNRAHHFGEIRHGMMGLSDAGCIAWNCWMQIPIHYPWVTADTFVAMPDHVHGILMIGGTGRVETPYYGVSTGNGNLHNRPEWKPGSVGSIIQQYKRACTVRIRKSGQSDFAWQTRFHDRVIRSDGEYDRIRSYIVRNPMNVDG